MWQVSQQIESLYDYCVLEHFVVKAVLFSVGKHFIEWECERQETAEWSSSFTNPCHTHQTVCTEALLTETKETCTGTGYTIHQLLSVSFVLF